MVDALQHGTTPSLLSFPHPGLDHFLGGMAGGEVILVGGWAAHGKSLFAGEVARYVARNGRSVVVMSREMRKELVAQRFIAQEAEVDAMSLPRA